MDSGTLQIGSFEMSATLFITIVSIVGPFIGSLLAIIITQRATLSIERAKWRQEAQKEYRKKQREALSILVDANSSIADYLQKSNEAVIQAIRNIKREDKSIDQMIVEFQTTTEEFKENFKKVYMPTHLRILLPEEADIKISEMMTLITMSPIDFHTAAMKLDSAEDGKEIVKEIIKNLEAMQKVQRKVTEVVYILQDEYKKTFV